MNQLNFKQFTLICRRSDSSKLILCKKNRQTVNWNSHFVWKLWKLFKVKCDDVLWLNRLRIHSEMDRDREKARARERKRTKCYCIASFKFMDMFRKKMEPLKPHNLHCFYICWPTVKHTGGHGEHTQPAHGLKIKQSVHTMCTLYVYKYTHEHTEWNVHKNLYLTHSAFTIQ